MTKEKRPKVTGVTIDVVYPDGRSRTITIDPSQVEAVFWSERAVMDILAPYYKKHNPVVSQDDYTACAGDSNLAIFGGDDKITFKKETVEKLWKTKGLDGNLPFMLRKTKKCIPI